MVALRLLDVVNLPTHDEFMDKKNCNIQAHERHLEYMLNWHVDAVVQTCSIWLNSWSVTCLVNPPQKYPEIRHTPVSTFKCFGEKDAVRVLPEG